MSRPVIGITTWRRTLRDELDVPKDVDTSSPSYQHAVARAGGLPILIPHTLPQQAAAYLDLLDGLILAGGNDVTPARYGSTRTFADEQYDANRDECEINLARLAKARNLPTLAICRGLQVSAVALGGTLVADIPRSLCHPKQSGLASDDDWRHDVTIDVDSPLGALIGGYARVNSLHHQAILQPGELRVAAHAPDGVVEAAWHPTWSFIGVQWHPERIYDESDKARTLFTDLIARAGAPTRTA
ncbi:MAG: gamma-glutamyl-gamma-aminobutyrate hydrolase family protein [Bowdeniella nasicola]|nr:gamma-glutamyl-gamma-aminobutyrate hydrolase family protein [Bowdeniella nasicola]